MTNRDIILLFKKDSGMSERDWKRFCKRYANRDIKAVFDNVKLLYEGDLCITPSFKSELRNAMSRIQTA